MIFWIFEMKYERKECKIIKKLNIFWFLILREFFFYMNVFVIKRFCWLDRRFFFYLIEFILIVGMNKMKIWLLKFDVVVEEVIIYNFYNVFFFRMVKIFEKFIEGFKVIIVCYK